MTALEVWGGKIGGAQERETAAGSGREIVEYLTRLEARQKSLEQRMVEGFAALGQRLDDTNRRIDDTNRRIDDINQSLNRRIDDLSQSLNQRIGETTQSLNHRIDETNQRIDELRQFLLWGFGVTFTKKKKRTHAKETAGCFLCIPSQPKDNAMKQPVKESVFVLR